MPTTDVATLTSTFPNLDSLTVGFYGLTDDLHVIGSRPLSPQQIVAYRNRNHGSRQWSACHRLKYLEGSILSLWTLGLRCEVDVLNIAVAPHKISQRTVHTLLDDTRPAYVQLSCSIESGQGLEYLRGQTLAYETVQDLELKLSVVEYQLIHTAGYLIGFLKLDNWRPLPGRSQERCRLQSLVIRLEMYGEDDREHSIWEDQYSKVKWDSFARLAFEVIPSLQEVTIFISYYPTIIRRREDVSFEGNIVFPSISRSPNIRPVFSRV